MREKSFRCFVVECFIYGHPLIFHNFVWPSLHRDKNQFYGKLNYHLYWYVLLTVCGGGVRFGKLNGVFVNFSYNRI